MTTPLAGPPGLVVRAVGTGTVAGSGRAVGRTPGMWSWRGDSNP